MRRRNLSVPLQAVLLVMVACPGPARAQIIQRLTPNTASACVAGFTLIVTGSGFSSDSAVYWNGNALPTDFVDDTRLNASVSKAETCHFGTVEVTAGNSNALSNSLIFTLSADPVITVDLLVPASADAGVKAFTLTVVGHNFSRFSVVQWNGSDRLTTFLSASLLEAAISASDVHFPGTAEVSVVDAGPGDAVSAAVPFQIRLTGPPPEISGIVPDAAEAGEVPFTLTVSGLNFSPTSVVQWNGSARTTWFVDANTLMADLLESDIAQPGSAAVTVKETVPGGSTSNEKKFLVETSPSLVFPQLVAGGGYATVLTVMNTGAGTASGKLICTGTAGEPFPLPPCTESGIPVSIPPGSVSVFTLEPGSGGPAKTGWARIESPAATSPGSVLRGVAVIKFADDRLKTVSAAPGAEPARSLAIPVDNDALLNRFTAVSVVNYHTFGLNVSVVLLDEMGKEVAVLKPAELNPIGPRQQVIRFLHELSPGAAGVFRGSVLLRSDDAMFAASGIVADGGVISVIPAFATTVPTPP